jgi:predicted nucleotidyltransferase
MIKYQKLPVHIGHLIPKALSYLQTNSDILFAYLFGSMGRGKPLPLSDLDLAIYLKDSSQIHEKKMEIIGVLMNLLETDEIDLVILNEAPLTLKFKILESKKVVVDHSPSLRHCFESLVMREYFDFSVVERAILERRFLSGR